MSKTAIWIVAIGGAALALWYLLKGTATGNTSSVPTQTPTTKTTATATTPPAYSSIWDIFNGAALQSGTASVNSAFSNLTSLSSAFGGNNLSGNGVSISGSQSNGVSGAGTAFSGLQDLTDF
jgi:hypothetical protein